ncbi:MAG: rRNA maturation RNase YbeY [Deferribacterota bacterium]|nr:rRNA maturation RNase YbeY [Deferribacterota bacterium]
MKEKQQVNIKVELINNYNYSEVSKYQFEVIADIVLEGVKYGKDSAEISLLLCDDEFIKKLNAKYRGCDYPTDVLAFPMNEPDEIYDPVLGDIVISIDTALKNIDYDRASLKFEVIYLFIHGILHLLGYDHEKSKEEESKMFNFQDILFDKCKHILEI